MKQTVLIVDDEKSIRESLRGLLEDEGYKVAQAGSAEEALHLLGEDGARVDGLLLDVWLPKMDGIEMLQVVKRQWPSLPVIVLSGHANIDTAVKATKLGAYHFVEKPFSAENLLLTLRHALRESRLERENVQLKGESRKSGRTVIGKSPVFLKLLEDIEFAAQSSASVLITGENGTGKESVAQLIHKKSTRAEAPFVEVNSAAIPEELIESELFGHEPGAFTGATGRKIGKFDQANQGTLFLDEIGDMSLKTQAKILRVLQEQRFERVGGHKAIEVDVRIIAATNKRLEEEIRAGHFREDLYYRLAVLPLEVPPLRHRKGDVALLVEHYLEYFAQQYGRRARAVEGDAMAILETYQWPGNVRELRNIVERLVIMTRGDTITLRDIPPAILNAVNASPAFVPAGGGILGLGPTYREAKEAFERAYLSAQLEKHHWNISKTAEVVGLERSNLHKKIKQLGIEEK